MDSEGDKLLAGAIENQEDDFRWLIWADWLEEHGDAERSEWVREMVADGKMTENYWRKKVAVEPLSAERAIAAMADWYSRVGTRRFKQYADEITRRSARDVQRGVWSVLDALGVK